ncbi:MAG: glycosyltransferase [Pseudomonadota bacterium]
MAKRAPRVTIVLAVHDGEAYLRAQLDSLAAQTWPYWNLIAGDDQSRDTSRAILTAFAQQMQASNREIRILDGPGRGGALHFLTLLSQVPAQSDRVAFCDQDDVWMADKLARAHAALETVSESQPCLYCSRTWVTGPNLETPRLSPLWPRTFGFRNALVQNIASGNTIVLNRAAIGLAQRAAQGALEGSELPAHDWWLYQVITGAGGHIIHDARPTLYYRQHARNQIGANRGLLAGYARAKAIWRGGYQRWNSANIAALQRAGTLTAENAAYLDAFARLRQQPMLSRMRALSTLGLYRQTPATQAALWIATALGRL